MAKCWHAAVSHDGVKGQPDTLTGADEGASLAVTAAADRRADDTGRTTPDSGNDRNLGKSADDECVEISSDTSDDASEEQPGDVLHETVTCQT